MADNSTRPYVVLVEKEYGTTDTSRQKRNNGKRNFLSWWALNNNNNNKTTGFCCSFYRPFPIISARPPVCRNFLQLWWLVARNRLNSKCSAKRNEPPQWPFALINLMVGLTNIRMPITKWESAAGFPLHKVCACVTRHHLHAYSRTRLCCLYCGTVEQWFIRRSQIWAVAYPAHGRKSSVGVPRSSPHRERARTRERDTIRYVSGKGVLYFLLFLLVVLSSPLWMKAALFVNCISGYRVGACCSYWLLSVLLARCLLRQTPRPSADQ